MSEAFIGETRIFPFNFAPRGWAMCNGQLLSIQQNQALFALLGTFYGGNGQTNFALPNLQGRVPLHMGQGPGLSFRNIGETAGEVAHTLLATEMPQHLHTLRATDAKANLLDPSNAILAQASTNAYTNTSSAVAGELAASLHGASMAAIGGSQAHSNMQPYLVLNICIALTGLFPSRN
jgi:microcystin-dependent protein